MEKLTTRIDELNKIQQEIGIDLITLFKVLKKGVYLKMYDEIKHYPLKLFGDDINYNLTTFNGVQVHLKPEDYRKTWALTKEELEKGE